MTKLTAEIEKLLSRELEGLAREIELFPDDESPWRTLPGVTNSAGNLALHLCGNLRHYVGAVLGGTGYVRQRDAEFATRSGTRTELAAALRETRSVVAASLSAVTDATLAAPFPEKVGGVQIRCDRFLLHLCTHAALHLGQAGYLRRAVTGSSASAGPIPVAALAGE
jgi:uncharacterized damage-inducible protein DinB